MKKTIIAAAVAAVFSASSYAQNLGFEDGTTTGWTSTTLSAVGSTTTQAGQNTWVISPYGNYMGQLQIQSGTFNQMTSALGLTSSSSTAITTLLQQQAQTGGGNPNPTTAGWVTKEVTLTAGQTFTLAWQYISVDYVPFNDGSIATLTQNGTNTATVNNYNQQYALLGFTNPGTGDYSTGSYGATGWQVATFQVSVDGTYTLGFGVFNLGDQALSPVLYIDEVQGSTTKNGQPFGAVAPNNATAPTAPSTPTPPPTPPAPTTVSTVGSGTTVDTSNLATNVTVNGGIIQMATTGVTLTNTFVADANGMTVDQNGNTVDFSGVISGTGGVTIANTGTGGGVTFSAVNTYTGTTTVNNGASLTNTGTIAGTVTNLGSFTNSGTTGNVTNGFNGDGNTASLVNSGTTGNVTNYSSFANSGTTGNVLNFGTFTNAGNTGTFQNAGVLNNNAGGTINNLGYNNYWVVNNGTINTVSYNGGTVNNHGTIGTINNQEAHGTFQNFGTVTGDVTTPSNFNNYAGGSVLGNYVNDGTLNNAGTLTTVTNNSTFNNNVGGVVSGLTTNPGTLNNSGTLGSVTSSGAFTNTGTAGAVTLTGGTFSNTGTAASVDNAAGLSLTNDGVITSTLSNTGTVASLTNNGTIGNVTGTITDVTNTGTLTNGGTFGTLTNSGTAVNNGTVNNVSNTGTYTNAGTTGGWSNSGTMSNTGTMGNGTNLADATFTNGGTVGTVDNQGTFTNSGTTGAVTNSGWFTNALNAVVGFFTNNGTAINAGTTGDWTNNSTMTNTGTMTNGTNNGTYTNAGTVGNVTNTGTFTNSGNTGVVSNSGTFNYNGGTLGGYEQTGGTTVMDYSTPLSVTNNATLGGGLTINNSPTAYGKYNVLTAGSVTGTYGSFTSNGVNDYLKYSGNDVKLYVTPSATATQSSIDATAKNLSNAINLQSNTVTNALGNDCSVFGEAGACVSVNAGMSKAAGGDLYNGGLTVAKRVNDNWRVGVTTNTPFSNPTIGNVSQTSDPAFGVFATWTKEQLSIQGSAAFNQGTLTVNRKGPENGTGKMSVDNKAYQLKASYAIPASETVTVTPYAGVRYIESNYSGFTEQGPEFPLTVNSTKRNQTSAIAGVSVAKQLTEKLSGNVSVGVTQNLTGQSATFTGTSEIGGLTTFNSSLPSNGRTNPSFGAGLSYSVDKTTKVGVNVGVQQKGDNANISSVGLTITKGF